MIDTIMSALRSVVDLPQSVLAVIAGTLGSWGVTQRLKFWLPLRWSPKARELATQSLAFLLGFTITLAAFPYSQQPAATVAAVVVGLRSPALWNVMVFLVGLRWPGIAEKLSGARGRTRTDTAETGGT